VIAQLELPAPSAETITVTSEALQAAARHWAEQHCFSLSMWLMELSDAAKLDACPLRLSPTLAKELGLC